MTRVFGKFGRLVLVAVLSGVAAPQLAVAGHHGGGGNFAKSMKSGGNKPSSMKVSGNQFKPVQRFNGSSQKFSNTKLIKTNPGGSVWNKPSKPLIKTLPTQNVGTKVITPGKITKFPGSVLGQGPILGQRDGGIKPPKLNPKFPLPGGNPPIVVDPVINPFPGGKPPIVKPPFDPFPGGQPPVLDPGMGNGGGNGGGGNGGGGNGNGHCHNKCPWPIFWPVYNGGYWNNYNSGYCTRPTVIVNEAAPVVVGEVTPVSATVPIASGTNRVDLVLEDLEYVAPATMLVGPAYRVKFRNQGLAAAGAFRVAVVASVDGTADAKSPMALVDVAGLASGEASEVTVRLPKAALEMTAADGQAAGFTHLLVAADFDNLIQETDKTNNVAIVARTQLEVAAK